MTTQEKQLPFNGLDTLPYKYSGPKFDAHTHIGRLQDSITHQEIADKYNIRKAVGILWEDQKKEYEAALPGHFVFARFLPSQGLLAGEINKVVEAVREFASQGYPIMKFWYAPRWKTYAKERWGKSPKGFRLDDPQFAPVFSAMEDLELTLLIHVSDPDLFYKSKYQPASFFGTKDEHLQELENLIAQHPKLCFLAAHMAGQPEHLPNLSRLLDAYPNLFVDTASAKWMAREFASNTAEVKAFFTKHQDRILFGTDIVAGRTDREPLPEYYINRYLSYQALWETKVTDHPLPIPDPENNNETVINGLDLSKKILNKLYWENSMKLFGGYFNCQDD
jgi:hypothetical protein